MKRQWNIRRQCREARDGQARWDRAYQCLLQWSSSALQTWAPGSVAGHQATQEVHHESSCLCACVHPTAGPNTDH